MPIPFDSAAQAHLQDSSITISGCLQITLLDGRVFSFTNSSKDLTIDGVVFNSTAGQTPSAVQTTSGFGVDSIDIETLKELTGATANDILSGSFDHASFTFFIRNYEDTTQDFKILRKGRLGQITSHRNNFTIELRGMIEALGKQTLEMTTPGCRADLGDTRCNVQLDPPVWTALTAFTERLSGDANIGSTIKPSSVNGRYFICTVAGTSDASEPSWVTTLGADTTDGTVTWTAVESLQITGSVTAVSTAVTRIFQDSAITKADDFFQGGLLTWNTGLNAGRSIEIKRQEVVSLVPEIELALTTFFDIQIGDTYTMTRGCGKRLSEDCIAVFDNIRNMRAEPFVPHTFQISRATI